ncbi:MAG: hypothetical protein AUJ52_10065 [Elusimicrobia bacterium CG1_02_63_36]|nr:MAG: hypothetical protein AUJ52_10065 [Elusimicrobia bacterium CG1_02_63_36]PIP83214.1 MAG: hypothetical protein COR54_10640 [Elusimicrobia bacterium CG22_combo_CG10-13_8_21_14_all_63_91]PJA17626.1 MAG: hypothetical protein COX66_03740 [Elusimicrobia bacterium CG_4_10_14_0_2_um_filter_63_34]PJB26262.1 MAG: hypothetical protein CO113_04325 [Elusimicrobia bacterium CG_4_9_14_3_um_filter_62_55]
MLALALMLLLAVPAAAESERFLSVATEWANVRASPTTRAEVLWEAPRFEPLRILETRLPWYRVVDRADDSGWIHASVVRRSASVVVTAEAANLRAAPGMHADPEWVLDAGYTLRVLLRQGPWIKVDDEDGAIGWIHVSVVWGDTLQVDDETAAAGFSG